MNPYAESARAYFAHGWPCVIPVPPETKSPPPSGYTGETGRDTSAADVTAFCASHAAWSVALRLPDGIIGIDVDHYQKGTVTKRGADTLAELLAAWGPLPPTWSSTARGAGQPSRIMFYRVPSGRYATRVGEAIEIIQRHHRYAVVAPSWHHDAGGAYQWYDPAGNPANRGPFLTEIDELHELPELPAAWVAGLREGASQPGALAASYGAGEAMAAQILGSDKESAMCGRVDEVLYSAKILLRAASSGTRHDVCTERVHQLVQLGAHGHPGVGWALNRLAEEWDALTAGEGRTGEYLRMIVTSARKAVTVVGPTVLGLDPCPSSDWVISHPVPMPGDDRPDAAPVVAVPLRRVHPIEFIGVDPFVLTSDLDQNVADAALIRTAPMARYATDAGVWLLRGPDAWQSYGDVRGWLLSMLADRMPRGDVAAEKDSEAFKQAARRNRLMTARSAGAIITKMGHIVAAPPHRSVITLADLDREPWLLWAGGLPFDLRTSRERPTLAAVDPATPHMQSAACLPDLRPTPLWDAFLAAVWPDEAERAWTLRAVAVAVTGYSARILPILYGDTGRGKTQFVELLASPLGTYAHAASPKLLGGDDSTHPTILVDLKGRRLSFIDEGPRSGALAIERLKQLSGGGELTGHAMRQDPIKWHPTHTLILTTNDEPTLTDPALRARLRLIYCTGDPELVAATRRAIGDLSGPAWQHELPGVLGRLMREAAAYLADPASADMGAAPAHWRTRLIDLAAEQDPISGWLETSAAPDATGTPSHVLYTDFRAWCLSQNYTPARVPSATRWGRELTARGYPSVHGERGKRRPLRIISPGELMPRINIAQPPVGYPASPNIDSDKIQNGSPAPSNPSDQSGSTTMLLPSSIEPADGLYDQTDGLLTGLAGNPSVSALVPLAGQTGHSPDNSLMTDGSDGLLGETTPKHNNQDHIDQDDLTLLRSGNMPANPSVVSRDPQGTQRVPSLRVQVARMEAVAAAAGEAIKLPAIVDRPGKITEVELIEAAWFLRELIEAGGALTVDVETSGYPVGHHLHALRTVQLGNNERAVVLDAGDAAQARIARLAVAATGRLHAHSASADLVPLAVAGLVNDEAWERMYDTVIPAKLADPQSTGADPSLKRLAPVVLGDAATTTAANAARLALFRAGHWLDKIKVTTPVERAGWAQVSSACATMVRYAASDVLDTAELARRLPEVPAALLDRERAVQRVTARVALRGLRIDRDHVGVKLAEHGEARRVVGELVRALGVESPGSDQQLGARLNAMGVPLPRTPTGRPSVAAGVLDRFRHDQGPAGELVRAVLDYRHHDTVIGTFLEPYRLLCDHGDGRARPTVYTLGTDTGRMSCVRPNFQQLPREGGVRACVTADPGYMLVSADFAGVELRVAAALSGDRNLRQMIEQNIDIHWMIAREVFGPEATKADRYAVKRGVFGRLYGGGIPTLAMQVGVSESVMASAVDVLDALTPELAQWSRRLRDDVRRGAVAMPTYSGRIIHLTKDQPHKAPNYAIQGTARELLVDAIERWERTQWAGSVIMPIHDEVLTMVREDEAEAATAELARCMTSELAGVSIMASPSKPSFAWQDAA